MDICFKRLSKVLAAAIILAAVAAAHARVKLTTLPARQRVEIQLENPGATLVEEERIVTLLEGVNSIDFSWSNTHIDKASIQFRVLDTPTRPRREGDPDFVVGPDGAVELVQVINVSYPPGENSLVWEVYSEKPTAARVRISYIIARLTRSFNYRAVADNDETALTLKKYIRLDNLSGEGFGGSGIWAGFGNHFQREIGLNEAREMLAWKFTGVPVTKTFTFDWWTGQPVPDEPEERYVVMKYVLQNDEEHAMGLFALQRGKVRIFQEDASGGEAFLGEDWGAMTPIDGKMELHLGLARDIVVKRRITRNERHAVYGNLYHQEVVLEYHVENFKDDPATLDIVEDLARLRDELCGGKDHAPQWEVLADGTTLPEKDREAKDSRTLILHVPLEAAPESGEVEKQVVKVHLWLRNEW